MQIEYKYLDFYVNNAGTVLNFEFKDETVLQYSNNFIVRLLGTSLAASLVLLDILQPNGNTISGIEMILKEDIVINGVTYKCWEHQLTQYDTSVVGKNASYSQMKFSFYIENQVTNLIKTTDTIGVGIELNLAVEEADLLNITQTPTIFSHIEDLEDDIVALRNQVISLGGTPVV